MSTEPAFMEKHYLSKAFGHLRTLIKPREHFFVDFSAENSQFIRLNQSKVRQLGSVCDAEISITWLMEKSSDDKTTTLSSVTREFPLTGVWDEDRAEIERWVKSAQHDLKTIPADAFATLPEGGPEQDSQQALEGKLLSSTESLGELTDTLGEVDLAGIYASGKVIRSIGNSKGLFHTFSTETFSLDYSLYSKSDRAVKGTFAGSHFDREKFKDSLTESKLKLGLLEKSPRKLSPGSYRVYLEPAALADLVMMLSWGGISEAAIRQGESPLRRMREGQQKLSPLFSLHEDYSLGLVPRFNSEGKLAPMILPLISEGKLINTMISERTAKEYGIQANGAEETEALRSPKVLPGTLKAAQKLEKLGTGIWISNLHYLNWSDTNQGRITGMTRYACLWIEDGKIVAPIENMRFDDTLYSLLGPELEALSEEPTLLVDTGSYGQRALGGIQAPGALIRQMKFTL